MYRNSKRLLDLDADWTIEIRLRSFPGLRTRAPLSSYVYIFSDWWEKSLIIGSHSHG